MEKIGLIIKDELDLEKITAKQDNRILTSNFLQDLKLEIAKKLETKTKQIRELIVKMIFNAQSGHIGGCFSATELLTVLYYYRINLDPKNPNWKHRDRFILSKGHSAPLLYAILMDLGYIDKQELHHLRTLHSPLSGHPNVVTTPGIDMGTGSLGMGISAACGMAMAGKLNNTKYNVFVLVGDGELQEGQIWEAIMTAKQFQLNNLTVIVDNNKLQSNLPVKCVKNTGEIGEQFAAFGWHVIEIDGHNILEIMQALDLADLSSNPTVIVGRTCKGKGVSFMENNPIFHSIAPKHDEEQIAKKEIVAKSVLK